MKVKIGDTVWFHNFSGVSSGEVIHLIEKPHCNQLACVKQNDSFVSLEVDSRKMWETRQEATLVLAEKKQQEASRLLSEAADLFKRAGGMKPEEVSAD